MEIDQKKVLLDLDSKKILDGDYIVCHYRLIDGIRKLIASGYKVIDYSYEEHDMTIAKNNPKRILHLDPDASIESTKLYLYEEGYLNGVYQKLIDFDEDNQIATYEYFEFSPLYIYLEGLSEDDIKKFTQEGVIVKKLPRFQDRYEVEIRSQISHESSKEIEVSRSTDEIFSELVDRVATKSPSTEVEVEENGYGYEYYALDVKTNDVISGQYISVDALMVPIIQELESKGYHTTSCCAGHYSSLSIGGILYLAYDDNRLAPYAYPWLFISDNNGTLSQNDISINMNNILCGDKIDKYGYRVYRPVQVKYPNGLYMSVEDLKLQVIMAVKDLLAWAKALPPVRKDDKEETDDFEIFQGQIPGANNQETKKIEHTYDYEETEEEEYGMSM